MFWGIDNVILELGCLGHHNTKILISEFEEVVLKMYNYIKYGLCHRLKNQILSAVFSQNYDRGPGEFESALMTKNLDKQRH